MKKLAYLFLFLFVVVLNTALSANIQVDLISKWPTRFPKEPDMVEIDQAGRRIFCGFGNFICLLDENLHLISYVELGSFRAIKDQGRALEEGVQALTYDPDTQILYAAVGRQGMLMIDASTNTLAEMPDITYPNYLVAAHTDTNATDDSQYYVDEKLRKSISDLALLNGNLYLADFCFGLREVNVDSAVDNVLEETGYYKATRYSQYYAGGYHNIVTTGPRSMPIPRWNAAGYTLTDAQGNILYEQVPQRDNDGNILKDTAGNILYENENLLFDKSWAFVLDRYYGIRVLDLDGFYNPEDPDAERKINIVDGVDMLSESNYFQESLVTDLKIVGDHAYVTDLGRGFTVINVNYDNFYINFENNTASGEDNTDTQEEYVGLLPYYGNNIYEPQYDSSHKFDPDSTYEKPLPGNAIALDVLDDYAYVVGQTSGLTIVDIGQKLEATREKYEPLKDDYLQAKEAGTLSDEQLKAQYVALQKIRDENIVNHCLRDSTILHDIKLYAKDSNIYAYLADYRKGLIKVDVTDPMAVSDTPAATFDTPAGADAVCVYRNPANLNQKYPYIYTVDDDGAREGLRILSVVDEMAVQDLDDDGNPTVDDTGKPKTTTQTVLDPKLVGFYPTPGDARALDISDDYAYIADGANGLYIINISDPSLSNPATDNFTTTDAYDVVVKNGFAYVADFGGGLKIIDVSDGASRGTTISYPDFNQAQGVFVSGNYVFVADGENGLRKIDTSDSKDSQKITTYTAVNNAKDVFVVSNYAYVADGVNGLQVIDIGSDANSIYYNVATAGEAEAVYVYLDYAYVAEGVKGMEIIDLVNRSVANVNQNDESSDTLSDPAGVSKGLFVYQLGRADDDPLTEYVFLADGPSGLRMISTTPEKEDPPFESKPLDENSCFITSAIVSL